MRRSPVLLFAASGLVGDGSLDETCLQGGVQVVLSEIVPVGEPHGVHELPAAELLIA